MITHPTTVLFRADADAAMGTGHVMRCLALAQALQARGVDCHFVMARSNDAVLKRLDAAGIVVRPIEPGLDLAATLEIGRKLNAAAYVIDGYHLGEIWRAGLRQGALGRAILAFADGAFRPAHADLLLDAASSPSSDPAELFGPAYVLLRRDLVEAAREQPRSMTSRDRLLVTFGGTDPAGLTLPVLRGLSANPASPPVDVVIGGGVPDACNVARAVARLSPRITVHIDPMAMAPLMCGAGLAISAAGSTIGELAALGVPAVIAVVADNQSAGAEASRRAGWCDVVDARAATAPVAILVARALQLWRDRGERERRAAIARAAVDPDGADRVAELLLSRARLE